MATTLSGNPYVESSRVGEAEQVCEIISVVLAQADLSCPMYERRQASPNIEDGPAVNVRSNAIAGGHYDMLNHSSPSVNPRSKSDE